MNGLSPGTNHFAFGRLTDAHSASLHRAYGPENCDDFFESTLDFLASPGGWLVFNTHGLDEEGWGPMSSRYLRQLLAKLVRMEHVEILPAGAVVQRLPPE